MDTHHHTTLAVFAIDNDNMTQNTTQSITSFLTRQQGSSLRNLKK